jgi:hypothetical protein
MNRFLRPLLCLPVLYLAGCAAKSADIRRLSPLAEASQIPSECRLVSVMAGSPAERAGLRAGDVIQTVNGARPADASAVSELINKSGNTADLVVVSSESAAGRNVKVSLKDTRPRLGAVCNLTGWRKPGITAAGNESVTLFQNAASLTVSGIIDKSIVFLRVRVTNSSNFVLEVRPSLFEAFDANHQAMPLLSPNDVMCFLYGERGSQLLATKQRKKQSVDADTGILHASESITAGCPKTNAPRFSGADMQYAEANADYVANESLWPKSLASGATADGLIYFPEPTALPFTVKAKVGDNAFAARLGLPLAAQGSMKESELVRFLEAQKKGTPLRITLKKGRVFVGRFSSWDPIDEKAWFDSPGGGLLSSVGYPLTSIRSAEPLETLPPKTQPVSEQMN